jgi:hypothetical protein
VGDKQLGHVVVDGVQQRIVQLGVGWAKVTVLEQDSDLGGTSDRVVQRVGVAHGGAGVEQDLETGRVVGLAGVVDGLAVVGIGAVLEQQSRGIGVVCDAGGAVEDRHRAELVVVDLVGIGATLQQQPDRRDQTVGATGSRA